MDQQIPSNTNFKYYSPHDFHADVDINNLSASNNVSVLHSNIRSLSGNHEKLLVMLDQLNFKFSVIGLSEIKLKVDQSFLINIEVPGYDFISQASLSGSGGVGFYVRNDLNS